jgi:hypothetical protein
LRNAPTESLAYPLEGKIEEAMGQIKERKYTALALIK